MFEPKAYKRLGAMIGAIIGVISMLIAIGTGHNMFGAILLVVLVCAGTVIGSMVEKMMCK